MIAPLAGAQSTAFTYQGRLDNGPQPTSGLHDFRFTLFEVTTGGVQLVAPQCIDNVTVTNGLFTTTIDFGQQFATTSSRYLQIEVRADTGLSCANPAGLVLLGPRQLLTAAPMASSAKTASSLSAPDGAPANAVYVDNAGWVGVGTLAPQAPVHISTGNVQPSPGEGVRITGTAAGNTNVSYLSFGTTTGQAVGYVGDGSTTDSDMYLTSYLGDVFVYTPWGAVISATTGGNVGVGTVTPAAKLDVRGDIRLGPTGQYRAVSGEENLRMLRGRIDGNGTINSGSGFTCVRFNEGNYGITFNTPFTGTPSVTATCVVTQTGSHRVANILTLSTTQVSIWIKQVGGSDTDSDFHFIIVGPR